MTARNLARVSNDFEPSSRSLALDELLSTREVAALLGLSIKTVANRIWRRGLEATWSRDGRYRYWTRRQVEQIRRAS